MDVHPGREAGMRWATTLAALVLGILFFAAGVALALIAFATSRWAMPVVAAALLAGGTWAYVWSDDPLLRGAGAGAVFGGVIAGLIALSLAVDSGGDVNAGLAAFLVQS